MRNVVIALAALGVLSGCGVASRDRWVYARPGVSETQLRRDEQACEQQAVGSLENKVPTFGQTMNRDAYNDCMRARGYDVSIGSTR
jgi:hypothetical protein